MHKEKAEMLLNSQIICVVKGSSLVGVSVSIIMISNAVENKWRSVNYEEIM